MRIERRDRDTVNKAGIRISEEKRLTRSSLIGDPIREIAGQRSEAGKEMWAKKGCTPPDDRTVAETLPHEGRLCESTPKREEPRGKKGEGSSSSSSLPDP